MNSSINIYLAKEFKAINEQALAVKHILKISHLLQYIVSEETGNSLKFSRQEHIVLTFEQNENALNLDIKSLCSQHFNRYNLEGQWSGGLTC